MTLDEAKEQIAKRYGYDKWADVDFYALNENANITEPPYYKERLQNEAAELYCADVREELEMHKKAEKIMSSVLFKKIESIRQVLRDTEITSKNIKPLMSTINEIPRRFRLDLNEPAELAIHEAMQAVEKMPPDVRLTQAGIKLQEAKNLVADYIDGNKP